eukprot:GHVU01234817.1.p1 GENE.GHVU01234817.1~~GHVU01234817.1.p1  ORF type:complete len:387 (+),score=49.60 GHVU01234817.1:192-1352(+)
MMDALLLHSVLLLLGLLSLSVSASTNTVADGNSHVHVRWASPPPGAAGAAGGLVGCRTIARRRNILFQLFIGARQGLRPFHSIPQSASRESCRSTRGCCGESVASRQEVGPPSQLLLSSYPLSSMTAAHASEQRRFSHSRAGGAGELQRLERDLNAIVLHRNQFSTNGERNVNVRGGSLTDTATRVNQLIRRAFNILRNPVTPTVIGVQQETSQSPSLQPSLLKLVEGAIEVSSYTLEEEAVPVGFVIDTLWRAQRLYSSRSSSSNAVASFPLSGLSEETRRRYIRFFMRNAPAMGVEQIVKLWGSLQPLLRPSSTPLNNIQDDDNDRRDEDDGRGGGGGEGVALAALLDRTRALADSMTLQQLTTVLSYMGKASINDPAYAHVRQ